MKRMKKLIILFLPFLLLASCCRIEEQQKPYLVVLSMDGFRWDYPDSIPTPNLDAIAATGVKAVSLRPAFPSSTFPNHYTMATGLYPDHHGIVLNNFYDPAGDRHYRMRDRQAVEDGSFYGGEPIWVTAEKQGMRSASYFWVGSEAPVQGYHPSIFKKYEHDFPYAQRIDSVIAWLQLPEPERPQLIMWYMHEPDRSGHIYGPFAEETNRMIMYQDSLLGVYISKIEALPLAGQVNLIITSDHGMQASDPERTEYLKDYIKEGWIADLQGYNPNFSIWAAEGCVDSLYEALQAGKHFSAWKAGQVPERLNYGTHPRCGDIIICADSAWRLKTQRDEHTGSLGDHGYDNRNTDMHAIFYATGPAFKNGYKHPVFDNVDLYPLMAHILGLVPAEVDGKFENVKDMLKP
jgi:predicted AlkP superfamily pyrophosphatase or phosphodiesterase